MPCSAQPPRLPPLFTLALLCASACPPPLVVPEDGGTLDFVGRSCNVDAECGTLRCDKVRRQCICLSDESCKPADPSAAPRFCNNYTGLCVTEISGCTSDTMCGQSEYCDPSIRACRPLKTYCEPCAANNECGGVNDNCLTDATLSRKFCGTACNTTADCPRGSTCTSKEGANTCWPDRTPTGAPATCKDLVVCTPDSLRTCNASADCGDVTQRCDPAKGKCVAIQQVCPYGTTCDPRAKLCVADCVQDQDCGDPRLKCVNRVCEPINDCTTDTDCAANKVCTTPPGATIGQCTAFCQQDTDCPLGQTCRQSGTRFACLDGCASNQGCALDRRCNTALKQCEGPVVGAVRICQTTSACNSCELCDGVRNECGSAKTTFPFCTVCTSPSECPGGTCVALPDGVSYCARTCGTGTQECPQGFTCLSLTTGGQACVPADRSCTGKCP